jgi:nucleotide-binding universal stress UspA family protein
VSRGTVVFGTDFSPIIRRAIPWVRDFIAPGHEVVLAHAIDHPPLPGFLQRIAPASASAGQFVPAALARLDIFANRSAIPDATLVARGGRADEVLLTVAAEYEAGLVVIGAHGIPCRPWKRVGTTAERLLRAATRSVLVANGPMASAPARIIVALDDAAITPRVIACAGALAARNGSDLYGVHVLSVAAYSHLLSAERASGAEATLSRRLEADLAEETLRWLRELWANTNHAAPLHAEVLHGDPADEILRLAAERSADLIVMGRYGAGRVFPALLGSVLGSVVAGAECPVLIVAD